jgi:hypothetical protein
VGGHFRIPPENIESLQQLEGENTERRGDASSGPASRPTSDLAGAGVHCWEFYAADGDLRAGCRRCLVYKAQAEHCFEMSRLPRDSGFEGLFCEESCERCLYYHEHVVSPLNILLITSREELKVLAAGRETSAVRIRLASCEYECSFVVDAFRPDVVVIDCVSQAERAKELCEHLIADPRIPNAKVVAILPATAATQESDLPAGVIGLSLSRGASIDQLEGWLGMIETKISSTQVATSPPVAISQRRT